MVSKLGEPPSGVGYVPREVVVPMGQGARRLVPKGQGARRPVPKGQRARRPVPKGQRARRPATYNYKFVTPLSRRVNPANPGYCSAFLTASRADARLRLFGADYGVLPVSSHGVQLVLRPRTGSDGRVFANLSDTEPDPVAFDETGLVTDLPVLVPSDWAPSHGLADVTAGAPVIPAEDLSGAQLSEALVTSLPSGAGKVALLKSIYLGVGSTGALELGRVYDLDNQEEKEALCSSLPDSFRDWVDLICRGSLDANVPQMTALLNNAEASDEPGLLASLLGEERGTTDRTPIDHVPPRGVMISRSSDAAQEYMHSLGRQVQPASSPESGGTPGGNINVVAYDEKTDAVNAQVKAAKAKYAVRGSAYSLVEGEFVDRATRPFNPRFLQVIGARGMAVKKNLFGELYTGTKKPSEADATLMSPFRFGDELSDDTISKLLTFDMSRTPIALANTSTNLSGFMLTDLGQRPSVTRTGVKAMLAAEESVNPAGARAKACGESDTMKEAFFFDIPDVKRLCANFERLDLLIYIPDKKFATRMLKKVRAVYDLASTDAYAIWWKRPSGGQQSRYANWQLVVSLEQYHCVLIQVSRDPGNYTAANRGDLESMDLSPMKAAERLFDKRMEAYDDAVHSGSKLKLFFPAVTPHFMLPSYTPVPDSGPARAVGTPAPTGRGRAQSPPPAAPRI
ncbi:hypothetical protein THAOC_35158, partial [Thalassiosira oceanica]